MKKITLLQTRASGILMPVFSLPSAYGIGTMGKEAYRFVDFLKASGQTYWQILPLGPTGFGDSPYQSYSTYAGNPYFIDLETVCEEGYLLKSECDGVDFGNNAEDIDYEKLYKGRFPLFRKAYKRFCVNTPVDFEAFCQRESAWLSDYAIFMALKDENGGKAFTKWDEPLKLHKRAAVFNAASRLSDDVKFYKMLQYFFYTQWEKLKKYANTNGIAIIGDVPIYVAPDSADVWANPDIFLLDEERKPIKVAGCPPDAFTYDGQLWGNPLYRWDVLQKDGYSWWCKRLRAARKLYDVIRFDHFRGFEAYYTVPANRKTAKRGKWEKGPGLDFFQTIEKKLGKFPIIAEDLGFLTDGVYKLLRDTGYPGMKVLEFAFGDLTADSEYLVHNIPKNAVAYVGTHDNQTVMQWLDEMDETTKKAVTSYFRLTKEEGANWSIIKTLLSSPADTAIVQMQDFLGLGEKGRINEPSTLGKNWRWRILPECLNPWLADLIYKATDTYKRIAR